MVRELFTKALRELRDDILVMASQVAQELRLALAALNTLDVEMAKQVNALDRMVNQSRFDIEERCFTLVATQQPTAGDLRLIFAVTNMIVDLERMGDQTKGIAKVIPELAKHPEQTRPLELKQMGQVVSDMLNQAMVAYSEDNVELAKQVIARDDEVDQLYANVFTQVVYMMARVDSPDKVTAAYELLRAARELERFGDLATNIADRSIYLVTGTRPEARPDATAGNRGSS